MNQRISKFIFGYTFNFLFTYWFVKTKNPSKKEPNCVALYNRRPNPLPITYICIIYVHKYLLCKCYVSIWINGKKMYMQGSGRPGSWMDGYGIQLIIICLRDETDGWVYFVCFVQIFVYTIHMHTQQTLYNASYAIQYGKKWCATRGSFTTLILSLETM